MSSRTHNPVSASAFRAATVARHRHPALYSPARLTARVNSVSARGHAAKVAAKIAATPNNLHFDVGQNAVTYKVNDA